MELLTRGIPQGYSMAREFYSKASFLSSNGATVPHQLCGDCSQSGTEQHLSPYPGLFMNYYPGLEYRSVSEPSRTVKGNPMLYSYLEKHLAYRQVVSR